MPVACGGLPRSLPTDRNLNTESTNPIANNVVAKAIGEINNKSITDEEGVNGIRYYNNKLQYNDGEKWNTISTGDEMVPQPVTEITCSESIEYKRITVNNEIYSETFDLQLSWEPPIEYDIKCASYNIYKYIGENPPTEFNQFGLVTNTIETSYSLQLYAEDKDNIPNLYILIASVSSLGKIQTNMENIITGIELIDTSKTITVGETLEDTSWENISLLSECNIAEDFFEIGDEKTISLNNIDYTVQIYDFNHDDLSDGSGKAGITFGMKDCYNKKYEMNSSGTNVGGWESSYMRTTVIPLIEDYISDELKTVLKKVDKKTSEGNESTTINTTEDYLFLFSEVEIFGSITYSAEGEGTKYPIFTDDASRIKKISDVATIWWERSPLLSNTVAFCRVLTDGTNSSANASLDDLGVVFGFCV